MVNTVSLSVLFLNEYCILRLMDYDRQLLKDLVSQYSIDDLNDHGKHILEKSQLPENVIFAANELLKQSKPFLEFAYDDRLMEASAIASNVARKHGIDTVLMNYIAEDILIAIGCVNENDSLDLYINLSDVDEQVRPILRKAEEGDAESQYLMGLRFRCGDGVFQDDTESVRWLRMAAEQGHAYAMYEMGVVYSLGMGVQENDIIADEWFSKASEKGVKGT